MLAFRESENPQLERDNLDANIVNTEQERLEYQGYVRANKFIATLQRQARRILNPAL